MGCSGSFFSFFSYTFWTYLTFLPLQYSILACKVMSPMLRLRSFWNEGIGRQWKKFPVYSKSSPSDSNLKIFKNMFIRYKKLGATISFIATSAIRSLIINIFCKFFEFTDPEKLYSHIGIIKDIVILKAFNIIKLLEIEACILKCLLQGRLNQCLDQHNNIKHHLQYCNLLRFHME